MNKHILMLAKQSGLIQYESDGKMEEVEKFAELIVKECCLWIDGAPTSEEGTVLLTKQFIIVNIKNHFGVE